MASGIGVCAKMLDEYKNFKMKSLSGKFMVLKINDEKTEIVLEHEGGGGIDAFAAKLPTTTCRYGVYDNGLKLQFVMWTPDSASVKERMLTSSSKDALKNKLDGVGHAIEAHDSDDLRAKLGASA